MIKNVLSFILTSTILASAAWAADSQVWGEMIISNITSYGAKESLNPGPLFVLLQTVYIKKILFTVVLGVPVIFLLHYRIVGAKVFAHGGDRIYVFSLCTRAIHFLAAVSFILLVPTGLMIVFGKYLGGGSPVLFARHLHGLAMLLFAVAIVPMFLFWFVAMLPTLDDIKWLFILGGYLSKEKKEIPAGKFNAGQKIWFWIATLGGLVMTATGSALYLQDFNWNIAATLGLSQIDLLRYCAIVHNGMAIVITALFFTHLYMVLFAIQGAVHSMITGYKEEEEVRLLHSSYYKKLQTRNQT